MKYRYYFADLFKGSIEGSNDALLADMRSRKEGYLVVDAQTGERLYDTGDRLEVIRAEDTHQRQTSYEQFRQSLRTAHVKLHSRKIVCHKQLADGIGNQQAPAICSGGE